MLGSNKISVKKYLNKKVIISVIIVVLAIILAVFLKVKFFTKTQQTQNTVRYNTLTKTNLSKSISTSGNIKSKTSAGVTSELDTVVKQINVSVGDQVKAGDVIAVMDTTDLEAEIAKLKSSIEESQAKAASNLAEKQAAYESAQSSAVNSQSGSNGKSRDNSSSTTSASTTTQDSLEKAKSEYESALESYENSTSSSTESQLEEKESELAKAQITAPFDGTITEINAVVGEKCSSSLFTIQDLNSLIVNVNIDESDISKVQVGQKATIVVDAADGATLDGQVISVSPVANNYTSASSTTSSSSSSKSSSSSGGGSSQGSTGGSGSSQSSSDVTFSAQVQVDTLDSNVKVGMSSVVNIILEEEKDVFAIPYESIVSKGNSSSIYIAEEDDGKYVVKEVAVTCGMESDINVEIQGDDIKEGMKVLGNPSGYNVGDVVEINDKQGKDKNQNNKDAK